MARPSAWARRLAASDADPAAASGRGGLEPHRDCTVRPFDVLVGKHGDHIGGERDAVKALLAGEVDAACMIDGNQLLFGSEGDLPSGRTRVLAQTAPYDHCNFTVLEACRCRRSADSASCCSRCRTRIQRCGRLLDLEGLKEWKPGRTHGMHCWRASIDRFGTIDAFVDDLGRRNA